MTSGSLDQKERSRDVERGYRWAFLLMAYGLLASTAYRSFVFDENSWDLLTLVIVGGLLAAVYEARPSAPVSQRGLAATILTLMAVLLAAATLIPWL